MTPPGCFGSSRQPAAGCAAPRFGDATRPTAGAAARGPAGGSAWDAPWMPWDGAMGTAGDISMLRRKISKGLPVCWLNELDWLILR